MLNVNSSMFYLNQRTINIRRLYTFKTLNVYTYRSEWSNDYYAYEPQGHRYDTL